MYIQSASTVGGHCLLLGLAVLLSTWSFSEGGGERDTVLILEFSVRALFLVSA